MNKFLQLAGLLAASFAVKLDAGQTAVLARQLEYIDTAIYETKYAALKGRTFVPLDTSVPAGAQTVTYRMWDYYGLAKVVANYADDIPLVDAVGKEFTSRIKTIADGYIYSIEDLAAAAMSGVSLDTTRATVARRVIEQSIDAMVAFGLPEAGMPGLLNHPNVPIVAPDYGDWLTTPVVAEILSDLRKLVSSIVTTTNEVHAPDTLLLPTSIFEFLAGYQVGQEYTTTLLQVFLQTSPHIKNIDSWHKLETAGADGGPRALAYLRNKEVLDMVISQDFIQLPPQPNNLAFKVPCYCKVGGVRVRYPLAMAYMDGI
jgi:hypothetical protein